MIWYYYDIFSTILEQNELHSHKYRRFPVHKKPAVTWLTPIKNTEVPNIEKRPWRLQWQNSPCKAGRSCSEKTSLLYTLLQLTLHNYKK